MSMHWTPPAPALIVNDETGEFVMTHNTTSIIKMGKGARVFVRETAGNGFVDSPLSPKELYDRLFITQEDEHV